MIIGINKSMETQLRTCEYNETYHGHLPDYNTTPIFLKMSRKEEARRKLSLENFLKSILTEI